MGQDSRSPVRNGLGSQYREMNPARGSTYRNFVFQDSSSEIWVLDSSVVNKSPRPDWFTAPCCRDPGLPCPSHLFPPPSPQLAPVGTF